MTNNVVRVVVRGFAASTTIAEIQATLSAVPGIPPFAVIRKYGPVTAEVITDPADYTAFADAVTLATVAGRPLVAEIHRDDARVILSLASTNAARIPAVVKTGGAP